jgi:hypothetical protein
MLGGVPHSTMPTRLGGSETEPRRRVCRGSRARRKG